MKNKIRRLSAPTALKSMVLKSIFSIGIAASSLVGLNAQALMLDELSLNRESIALALRSPDSWVQGYLPQDEAEPMQMITKSDSPFLVRLTVVQRFEQEGCGRLQLDMSQANVPTKDFSTVTFVAPPTQFNACEDGDPPEPAFDVQQATQEARSKANKEYKLGGQR